MLRGEIRLIDLDPARGAEANKRRPAVIVSNDGANRAAARLRRGVVTVVPITSKASLCLSRSKSYCLPTPRGFRSTPRPRPNRFGPSP